ncbi:MAG: NUDIX domain-containing protein [Clostridia bacterium]|nr:NUDIX domain-containing protein [Clostridia bacterium]
MEYREVWTRDGKPTGRVVEKHRDKQPGEYFRHVIVILKTQDSPAPGTGEGRYIVQQRSLKARYYAGKWDVTGGGVQAGEGLEETACREVQEELGLSVTQSDLHPAFSYRVDFVDGSGFLITVFACRAEVPPEGCDFNRWEVNDVRTVPFSEFCFHVLDHNDDTFRQGLETIEKVL